MYDFFIASHFRNQSAVLELARRIHDEGMTGKRHIGERGSDSHASMTRFEAARPGATLRPCAKYLRPIWKL